MTKIKKKKHAKKEEPKVHVNYFENIPEKYKNIIAAVIILIPLLYYFLPFQLSNLRPVGNDYLSSVGQTHRWVEWDKKTGETTLWNPSIFAGEPIYPRITPNIIQVGTLIRLLGKFSYWVFWYMFLGAMGFYFFMRYEKIPWYLAIIVAVIFILLPDWQALIGEGHNSKLRAIMTLPWVFLSFSYLFDKNNWFGAGLFAFAFTWLIRSHHFQIVFYGIMVLFFIYVYPYIKLFVDKKYKKAVGIFIKFGAALLLTVMTAAQPLITTNEFAKYTTRGGHPVNIGNETRSAEKAKGVSFKYATQWSFSPTELPDFFIPRFSGGLSAETYEGSKFPQLRGQQVPGYWGEKPFNGNYATMGMIMFLFALIGIGYYKKDKLVIGLAVFSAFSIFLSFGRHFPELYKLFYYYVPFFSKFRAPAMILNVTFITILFLAGYGLKAVTKELRSKNFKWVITIFGIGLGVAFFILLINGSFSYSTPLEVRRYNANTLRVLKEIRQEFLIADTQKLILFLLVASAAVVAYLFKKIKVEYFVIIIFLISTIEIFSISNKAYHEMNLNNPKDLEYTEFRQTPITEVLQKAKPDMRAIVLGQGFTSNHYAYYYPIINGYSAIKLQLIQDVIEHNLYNADTPDRINWNLIDMLNGKFVISPAKLSEPFLKQLAYDKSKKQILYLNSRALPKAWFVKEIKTFDAPKYVVLYMNTNGFNPKDQALMVAKNLTLGKKYSGTGTIDFVKHNPNYLEFNVKTDSTQFMVISEVYYPKGWIARLDGKEIPIYQVDHLLRGVKITSGSHKLTFNFKPKTYYASLTSLWIGDLLTLAIIIVFGYLKFREVRLKNNQVKTS